MLHRKLKLSLGLALCLLLVPSLASAVPVALNIMSGNQGGIGFSTLHTATTKGVTIGGNDFRRNGNLRFALSGSLTGDLVVGATVKLTFDAGTISVAGGPDILVTGGMIEWPGFDPDAETNAFIGTLETSTHGTFNFFDNQSVLAPGAQTFAAGRILLWGNNWTGPLPAPGSGDFPNWGIDLGIDVLGGPAPEPAVAGMLGLGLAGLVFFGRRR